jgi:uncharacterized lipoprotein YddW (UPF0748 family)
MHLQVFSTTSKNLVLLILTVSIFYSCGKSSRKIVAPPPISQSPLPKAPEIKQSQTQTKPASQQPTLKPETRSSERYKVHETTVKPTPREFRGVWIATVANIDWPTSSTDPFSKQQADFIALLEYYKKLNFNAVIIQIRTAGDAFYPSAYAPWSRYLTGKEGQKPNTNLDPLAWMIEQAHLRGLEFHAWLNPYRATMNLDTKVLSPSHDLNKNPEWMIKYDTKYYYNPGLPEVKAFLVNIIKEVVQNYDIDAIHFDDYFYPYKVAKIEFQDVATFKKYGKKGQTIDDWRRENVNELVQSVYQTIKNEKPWVQFGVSPFGVWRNQSKDPNGSNTRAGHANYDDLYADPITWMKNGWIDYLVPQLYWSMDFPLASYKILTNWWSKNHHNTNVYIGNGPYKIRNNADNAWDNPQEIPQQIAYTRATPHLQGNAYFSAQSLYLKNKDIAQNIFQNFYQKEVLTPVATRQKVVNEYFEQPILLKNDHSWQIRFNRAIDNHQIYSVIHSASTLQDLTEKSENCSFNKIRLSTESRRQIDWMLPKNQKFLSISLIDRYGIESNTHVFELLQ